MESGRRNNGPTWPWKGGLDRVVDPRPNAEAQGAPVRPRDSWAAERQTVCYFHPLRYTPSALFEITRSIRLPPGGAPKLGFMVV